MAEKIPIIIPVENQVRELDPKLLQAGKADEKPKFGRAAAGMSREYAEGLRDFKQTAFQDIRGIIPKLEKAFPDLSIVVRPHPTVNPQIYHEIAKNCERVKVTNEGNAIP